MRILKHKDDEYGPGTWKPMSSTDLYKWRVKRRDNMRKGVSTAGWQTGTRNLPRVDEEHGDQAIIEKPKLGDGGINDPLETQKQVVDQFHAWVNDPKATLEQRTARIAILRAVTGPRFQHMTDGEIGQSLGQVAGDLARESAERVYKRKGWDKPTDITGGGVRSVVARPEYDASEWAVPSGEAPVVDRTYPWLRPKDSSNE